MKVYRATKGSQFNQEKAQVYGIELEKIQEKHNGVVVPQIIVQEAKENTSPLHEYFEWNDTVAGEHFRISQARHLLNHLIVNVVINDTEKEQKAFFSVNVNANPEDEEETEKVYVSVETVFASPQLRKQVLANALKELEYWQEKYYEYRELSLIFQTIEKTRQFILKGGEVSV